jgi:hypothetical protein
MIADVIKYILSGFCSHNSFHCFEHLYLCARCSGIYIGIFTFFIKYFFDKVSGKRYLIQFIGFILLNIFYWIASILFHLSYNKVVIFFLGLPLGFAFGGTVIYNLHSKREKHSYNILFDLSFILMAFFVFFFILFSLRWFLSINIIFVIILVTTLFLIFKGIYNVFVKNKIFNILLSIFSTFLFVLLAARFLGQ